LSALEDFAPQSAGLANGQLRSIRRHLLNIGALILRKSSHSLSAQPQTRSGSICSRRHCTQYFLTATVTDAVQAHWPAMGLKGIP